MSAEIVDLGHQRLKQQLVRSAAVLGALGISIPPDALEPPKPESDIEWAERRVADAVQTMRSGDLLGSADHLNRIADYLRRLERLPRERAARNRKRRERRAAKKRSEGGAR